MPLLFARLFLHDVYLLLFFIKDSVLKCEKLEVEHCFRNLPCERIHLKFCKYLIGVHSKSTNFLVLSELGRFPLISYDIVRFLIRSWNLSAEFPCMRMNVVKSFCNFKKLMICIYTKIKTNSENQKWSNLLWKT